MKKYQSKTETINRADVEVFNFLSDFSNFKDFLPEQITEWEADENQCSFNLSGLGRIKLNYSERIPYNLIVVQPQKDNSFNVPFFLKVNLNKVSENSTEVNFVIEAEIPPMISFMVDKPLQNFVDIACLKLKNFFS